MDPHRSFSNSIVKGYSGEDTKGGAFWENNTMSKFLEIYNPYEILVYVIRIALVVLDIDSL